MVSKKKVLKLTLAAVVAFGVLGSKAFAQNATETVSFTVTQTVTVGGHELAPGRYTVRPSASSNALLITRADDHKFVTFVLPVSNDLGRGDDPAVNLVETGAGAVVSSVYFPDYGRAYYFTTKR
jgi:hypothetical protein